ncbi:hypothetical protein ACFL56_03775, partial [Candidatus Margulisiibacteriota bacterium]
MRGIPSLVDIVSLHEQCSLDCLSCPLKKSSASCSIPSKVKHHSWIALFIGGDVFLRAEKNVIIEKYKKKKILTVVLSPVRIPDVKELSFIDVFLIPFFHFLPNEHNEICGRDDWQTVMQAVSVLEKRAILFCPIGMHNVGDIPEYAAFSEKHNVKMFVWLMNVDQYGNKITNEMRR